MKRSCLLLVSGAISIFGIASPAFAEPVTDGTDFSVTVNPYLNVTLSSSDVHLPITPSSGGTFGETAFTATSSTNNALGYSLNLAIKDTNTAQAVLTTNLTSDTINVNDGTKPVIPTFSTDDILTSAEFSASTSTDHLNHWAMSVNTATNPTIGYKKALSEFTVNTSDGPIADDVTTLNLATKLDLLTPPGSYSAYFNFELVANVAPEPETPIDTAMHDADRTKVTVITDEDGDGTEEEVSLYAMQDMSSTICDSIATPTGNSDIPEGRLVDIRDNKVYWVAKLNDGRCWMTQNLDLDLTSGEPLDSTTTDLNAFDEGIYKAADGYSSNSGVISWTPSKTTYVDSNSWSSIWDDSSSYNPQSFDGGNYYFYKSDADSTNCGYGPYLDCPYFSATPFSSNGTHGHIGNNYSFMAAAATNGVTYGNSYSSFIGTSPQNSICPYGWSMPLQAEFASLFSSVSYGEGGPLSVPLWLVYNGTVHEYSENESLYKGHYGQYWANLIINGDSAIHAQVDSSGVGFQHVWTNNGNSVRCIARE